MKHKSPINIAIYGIEDRVVRVLVSLLILSVLSYVAMIGSITLSIISRKSMESETRSRLAEIHQLELDYLVASEKITLDFAHQNGFIDAKAQTFASVGTNVAFDGGAR